MTLRATVRLRREGFDLAADLDVADGEGVAVLGPNGAGKSTVLDCVAGVLRPGGTTVAVDGRDVTALPPHRRGIGLLGQDPLLFPHLSALDNVAFGRRVRGESRAEARSTARRWLAETGVAELADRKPGALSGGQAQRVALARVLATEPDVLLLDEPLAALDVDAAPAMRALLRKVVRGRGRPTVLVTHDLLDALALADTVLVLDNGQVAERGPARSVLTAPRTPFAARIAGVNLVPGLATDGGLRSAGGAVLSGLLSADAVAGEAAVAVFGPSAVSVFGPRDAGHGSPRNTAGTTVASLEPHGPVVRLRTGAQGGWAAGITADLTPAAVAELGLEPGAEVVVAVKATAVDVHPAVVPDLREDWTTA